MTAPAWRKRHWKALSVFLVVAIPVLIVVLWITISLGFVYSKGDRAGYLQKISRRGWICKTWEGELAMVNLPGAMPQIFDFTVRNDSLARMMENNLGKQVSITYEEHRGIPSRCFGETRYYVTNMRNVKP